MKWDKSLLLLLGLLFTVLIAGASGYMVLEEGWSFLDSLYMTVITLTTIGFGEVRELSPAGRTFTIILIISGIGVVATIVSRMGQIIVESGLNNTYGRMRMQKRVNKLAAHYIICGYGRIGSSIAHKLYEGSIDFVVIESDPDLVEIAQAKGFAVILGDSTNDATLLAAGIERARGTLLCINDDSTNVNIALAVRELNPKQNIIARGSDPGVEYRLIRAGADKVVYPLRLGGEQIARLIADESEDKQGELPAASQSLMGYELKLFKNSETSQSLGDFLRGRPHIRPLAINGKDGAICREVDEKTVVNKGDSVLTLINHKDEESGAELKQISLLEWSDDLSLGIAQIDDEHRMLFVYAQDFQKSVLNRDSDEKIDRLMGHLIRYTETHFAQEEVLMKKHHYPRLDEHHELHRRLTQRVMEISKDREYIFSDKIWEFLESWLVKHILVADKAFATYLAEHQAE